MDPGGPPSAVRDRGRPQPGPAPLTGFFSAQRQLQPGRLAIQGNGQRAQLCAEVADWIHRRAPGERKKLQGRTIAQAATAASLKLSSPEFIGSAETRVSSRESINSREKLRERSGRRTCFRHCTGQRLATLGSGERRRHHVPDRAPTPQSDSWAPVDREAPAAAGRVFPCQAEHDPSPGDRSGEPLLAEHALPHRAAGVRPRRRPQGAGLRGHQGSQHLQVSLAQICSRPAQSSQCHQEVVLAVSHHHHFCR